MSVISLPDQDDAIASQLDAVWETIKAVKNVPELEMLRTLVEPVRVALADIPSDQVVVVIERRRTGAADETPVKEAEFAILGSGRNVVGTDAPESTYFAETLDRSSWDDGKTPLMEPIDKLVLIHRLREVISQVGFTRFEPPAPEVDGELDLKVERQLLDTEIRWLPAVEHRGEGIFLQFKSSAVEAWARRQATNARVISAMQGFDLWASERDSKRIFPGGPYIMMHSLSHLLMTAIALDCGYPASSLRERVYAMPGRYGILIHTGSSDAEGTLGGLIEAGRRIGTHLRKALELGRLCSNDPVCAEHEANNQHEKRFLHGAACHGCLLIAETSCEQRNDFLDRGLVVPTVSTPGAAFFEVLGT